MVLTMSTFQASKEVLLNVLDVFVKDPLLDWLKAAGKNGHCLPQRAQC